MECFYGYLVGVLSIIVTILIGWQIFSVISLECRLRRIKADLTKRYKEDTVLARYDATGMALAQLGLALLNLKDYGGAFQALINALQHLYLGSNDNYNCEPKVEAIRMLNDIANMDVTLTSERAADINRYVTAVSKIENMKERENILRFILKAEITEDSAKS